VRFLALLFALCLPLAAQSLGHLSYRNRTGKALRLEVHDGGHPALITLRAEKGELEELRLLVLGHAGPEKMNAPGATVLKRRATEGWKVSEARAAVLLEGADGTYWRYTPGLVLPVRLPLGKDEWKLVEAELPARMFVVNP